MSVSLRLVSLRSCTELPPMSHRRANPSGCVLVQYIRRCTCGPVKTVGSPATEGGHRDTAAPPSFVQLDGWHEASHVSWWGHDFALDRVIHNHTFLRYIHCLGLNCRSHDDCVSNH